jgi:glutaryl-CoA dehydrogenase
MVKLNPFDLYNVESLLSEEELMIRDSVARFVDERAMPLIAGHFDNASFPFELVPEIAEMGLLGSTIEGYGCAGLNAVSYGLICQELERCDSGLRSFVSVQSSLCMYPIYAYGSEEQKQRWLPAMAAGEMIGCFGLTESHGGSDPAAMKTHARRDGDDWVVNGSKMWITNGSIADIAIVWAKTDQGIMGFVIEKGTEGFETRTIHSKMSLRASVTSELYFDNVRVPDSNRLPNVTGLKGPLGCLTQARYGIGWGAVGAAMSVYETARQYTMDRVQFGKPLAAFQLTQQKLVELHNEICKGLLLAHHCGRLKQHGTLTPVQVSVLKRDNVVMALQAARTARSMLGGNGIMGEFNVMRHMCNLETVFTYEGTHEVHTLSIGRALTGISAFV